MGEGLSEAVDKRLETLVLVASAAVLAVAGLTHEIDHDEGQYVAAVALMRSGWPYSDFAYLQTPLQPLLLAPLSMLPAGWLLVALRAANALFVLIAAGALLRGLRGRVATPAAAVAGAALVATDAVLFGAAVARNDALPLMLLAGAIALLLPKADGGLSPRRAALAFALLGLAISAKISMALPAAGAGLFLLLKARTFGSRSVWAAVVGGLAGLLPCLIFYAAAPERFWFGVFTYNLEAPQLWWTGVGEGQRLETGSKLLRLAELALKGAIPVALLAAVLDRRKTADRVLLDLMIVGGLVAACLPDPAFVQYLIPLTAPLYARLALSLEGSGPAARGAILAGIAGLSAIGLGGTAGDVVKAAREPPELVLAVRHARVIAAAAEGGKVVTLSPERAAGADIALSRSFATGPFLFRTSGSLASDALRLGHSPNWQRLGRLDQSPPAVIVTGGERRPRPPLHPRGLDGHLDSWARERGYQLLSPGTRADGYRLWVQPRAGRPAKARVVGESASNDQRE